MLYYILLYIILYTILLYIIILYIISYYYTIILYLTLYYTFPILFYSSSLLSQSIPPQSPLPFLPSILPSSSPLFLSLPFSSSPQSFLSHLLFSRFIPSHHSNIQSIRVGSSISLFIFSSDLSYNIPSQSLTPHVLSEWMVEV